MMNANVTPPPGSLREPTSPFQGEEVHQVCGSQTVLPPDAVAGQRRGVPLIDGIEKVTGRARYTADLTRPGDALAARIFRSPFSHAEIVRLDVSKARALDGVIAVVTGDDCPHPYGVLPVAMSEYPLAR